MTLTKLEGLCKYLQEKHDLKNNDNRRLFIFAGRNKLQLDSKKVKDFGISPYEYSSYYYQSKALVESRADFRKAYNELINRMENKEIKIKDSLKALDIVKQFRSSFGLKIKDKPSLLTRKDYDLHFKLLQEEIGEYHQACEEGDKVEVLDALVDIYYILCGAVLHHGMQDVFEEAFKEVHSSNMSKLENGKPLYREDGKVLKGKDYFPPDLETIIKKQ